jgi:radical SAM-linked protein
MESETKTPVARMRLIFSKEGATRYISHLDLARALERALNRAGMPVAYSHGFNRRPRLSLAAALPLGYTGEAEIADVWLTEPVDATTFMAHLSPKMPPGIRLRAAHETPLIGPSLQQQLAESIYEAVFVDPVDAARLREAVAAALAAPAILHERARAKGGKTQLIDLRPLILALDVSAEADGPRLRLRLVQTATQTGRPDDVLAALGYDPLDLRVHRVGLRFDGYEPPVESGSAAGWP